ARARRGARSAGNRPDRCKDAASTRHGPARAPAMRALREVCLDDLAPVSPSTSAFVEWFRSAAPYIHAFRGRTFVIACGGEVVADGRFVALSHDLNLLAALGVRIVLAFGTRAQIDALLKERRHRTRYRNGVRITDAAALKCGKEAAGSVRAEIEASLPTGLPNSP